jgi:hypothetical protein
VTDKTIINLGGSNSDEEEEVDYEGGCKGDLCGVEKLL